MKSWYLIYSKPRQETTAREQLERQGYKTYLPLVRVRRQRRGKTYKEISPMFPRYLFIYLSDGVDDWSPIRSTIGVSNLVKFGQSAIPVPSELISVLTKREDEQGVQVIEAKPLKKGEKVIVAEGPFEGYEGIFEAKSGKDRVVILLNILEKQVKLKMEQDKIEVIS